MIPKGIVIHHTGSHDVGIDVVRGWHVEERGWPDVGYNWLIRSGGIVEFGRPLDVISYHARNRNHTHIGIALTGCFSGTPPNEKACREPDDKQLLSLINLCKQNMAEFNIPITMIERHHAGCPGDRFPFEWFINQLRGGTKRGTVMAALEVIENQLTIIKSVIS